MGQPDWGWWVGGLLQAAWLGLVVVLLAEANLYINIYLIMFMLCSLVVLGMPGLISLLALALGISEGSSIIYLFQLLCD